MSVHYYDFLKKPAPSTARAVDGVDAAIASRRPSRAAELLNEITATGSFELDELARTLVVTDATLQAYLSAAVPIPLERQLCLALFVIERIPSLARKGRKLRAQVQAAIAFQEHATETHMQPPATRIWPGVRGD
jgi:hypothetical protein